MESASLFDYADKYPNGAAQGVTESSRLAALLIKPVHNQWQAMVLSAIGQLGDATWKEVSAFLKEDSRNVQPRFSELKELGLIIGTGQRRDKCETYRLTGEKSNG